MPSCSDVFLNILFAALSLPSFWTSGRNWAISLLPLSWDYCPLFFIHMCSCHNKEFIFSLGFYDTLNITLTMKDVQMKRLLSNAKWKKCLNEPILSLIYQDSFDFTQSWEFTLFSNLPQETLHRRATRRKGPNSWPLTSSLHQVNIIPFSWVYDTTAFPSSLCSVDVVHTQKKMQCHSYTYPKRNKQAVLSQGFIAGIPSINRCSVAVI